MIFQATLAPFFATEQSAEKPSIPLSLVRLKLSPRSTSLTNVTVAGLVAFFAPNPPTIKSSPTVTGQSPARAAIVMGGQGLAAKLWVEKIAMRKMARITEIFLHIDASFFMLLWLWAIKLSLSNSIGFEANWCRAKLIPEGVFLKCWMKLVGYDF